MALRSTLPRLHRVFLSGALLLILLQPYNAQAVGNPLINPADVYGNTIDVYSLANTTVTANRLYAKRVMFPKSGKIVSVRTYHKFTSTDSGYSKGSGGTLKYELRADDGTSKHIPSNTVLGESSEVNAKVAEFPVITFTSPTPIDAGKWYHLVVHNTDPNGSANYISENDLWTLGTPRNPVLDDMQFAVMYKDGSDDWVTRKDYIAIADFAYDDGTHFGNGYMESGSTGDGSYSHTAGGDNKVRQLVTATGGDKVVTSVFVRMQRESGSGAVSATLVTPSGAKTASATPTPGRSTWVEFPISATLMSGSTYYLELSAPSGSLYHLKATRDGNASGYDFHSNTVFSDGYAQFSTNGGGSWIDWDTWGNPRKDQDLHFYFKADPL
jgi:hypothetical protein